MTQMSPITQIPLLARHLSVSSAVIPGTEPEHLRITKLHVDFCKNPKSQLQNMGAMAFHLQNANFTP